MYSRFFLIRLFVKNEWLLIMGLKVIALTQAPFSIHTSVQLFTRGVWINGDEKKWEGAQRAYSGVNPCTPSLHLLPINTIPSRTKDLLNASSAAESAVIFAIFKG